MFKKSRVLLSFSLLILFTVVLAGCGDSGPRNCEITGTVTVDGTPVKEGAISFAITEDGDLPGGAPIVDGKYSASLTPGKKKVHLSAPDTSGFTEEEYENFDGLCPDLIPQKYIDEPLIIDVTESGTFDFELTSD